MARTAKRREDFAGNGVKTNGSASLPPASGVTGRYLVLLRDQDTEAGVKVLSDKVGLRMARSSDFKAETPTATLAGVGGMMFDEIGVGIVDADPDQYQSLALAATAGGPVAAMEPERIVYAIEADGATFQSTGQFEEFPSAYPMAPPVAPIQPTPLSALAPTAVIGPVLSRDYLEGLRDGIDGLLRRLRGPAEDLRGLRESLTETRAITETRATWGLQVTRVINGRFSGLGVKVAVLDTGLDLTHPDFTGRHITNRSFIHNETVQDRQGHGTHCTGTACGPQTPSPLPRYGIAFGASIFAGKVLNNQGSGTDAGILAGINWAVANKCRVISMSLGAPVQPGQSYSRVYDAAARRSLTRGSLIVAAAGNESDRRLGIVAPVGHPANCPSIMAVAALDSSLQVTYFSSGGIVGNGGQIDIAGPGFNVYSTSPMPARYRRLSGTSMATPHVAGIAALHAQANPAITGSDLWRILVQSARRLPLPASDVGAGLVQAP